MKLNRDILSAALASALLFGAPSVQAQVQSDTVNASSQSTASSDSQSDTRSDKRKKEKVKRDTEKATDLTTVQVSGFLQSIESSINKKRLSNEIVEAISAEDIGKLPEDSIADALIRLPGVTGQRVNGQESTLSLRGFGPDFSTTLLDGRQQASVSDNRSVQFDQYPAELIHGVIVYKTPNAALIGQGLAGTVNLQTIDPLQYDKRRLSVGLSGEKNSLGSLMPQGDKYGNRESFSYIDQFFNHTLGVSFGFARRSSPMQEEEFDSWGYPFATVNGQDNVHVIGGFQSFAHSTTNTRTGVMSSIQYEPNDFYHTKVDIYYSKFNQDEYSAGMQTGLIYGPGIGALSNAKIENNNVVSGTFTGVQPVIENLVDARHDNIFAVGWKNSFHLNEDWDLTADLSYSRARRHETVLESYAGAIDGTTDTLNFALDPATGRANMQFGKDYTNPQTIQLSDPGGWGQNGYVGFPHVQDKIKSGRLTALRSFASSVFSSLQFGVDYSKRTKNRNVPGGFLALKGNPDPTSFLGPVTPVPDNLLYGPVSGSFNGIPGVIGYNAKAALNQVYNYIPNLQAANYGDLWSIAEKETTGFAQLNIETMVGSIGVRGNVGVQVVHTNQQTSGYAANLTPNNTDSVTPITAGTSYNDYLPSLNLTFELTPSQLVRVAAAKQLARPKMDDLRANQNYNIPTSGAYAGQWNGNGGNPYLKPWRADAYDLSYENYFGEGGDFVIDGFFKKLNTYIYGSVGSLDFSGRDPGNQPQPASPIGSFSRPINGQGGIVRGLETSLSLPFKMITPALDGFGFIGNYAYTNSSIQPLGPGSTQPLPGLSRDVSSVTLYYEKNGFTARIGQTYRSDFVGGVAGFGSVPTLVYIRKSRIVDYQIGYEFQNSSPLAGLNVLLQVYNANNEPYRQYYGEPDLTSVYGTFGRRVQLGLRYSF